MVKPPKNKWAWIGSLIWSGLVILATTILDNLFYSSFVKKMFSAYGITEDDMRNGFWHFSIPLLIIVLGIWVIRFCINQGRKEILKLNNPKSLIFDFSDTPPPWDLEDAENSKLKPPKDSKTQWKEDRESSAFADVALADRRINMELDRKEEKLKSKTPIQRAKEFLQKAIDWYKEYSKTNPPHGNQKEKEWEKIVFHGLRMISDGQFVAQFKEVMKHYNEIHSKMGENGKQFKHEDRFKLKLEYLERIKNDEIFSTRNFQHPDIDDLEKELECL